MTNSNQADWSCTEVVPCTIFVSSVRLRRWQVKCWDSHGLCSSTTMKGNHTDWSCMEVVPCIIFVLSVRLRRQEVNYSDSPGLYCSTTMTNSNHADWSVQDFCLVCSSTTTTTSQLLRFAWSLLFYNDERQPYRLILHGSSSMQDFCLVCSSTTMRSELNRNTYYYFFLSVCLPSRLSESRMLIEMIIHWSHRAV
jgi:hypothetical protein